MNRNGIEDGKPQMFIGQNADRCTVVAGDCPCWDACVQVGCQKMLATTDRGRLQVLLVEERLETARLRGVLHEKGVG